MRLAERRGLLGGGRRLSRVQQFGLELLMVADAREASEDRAERLKMAILSADPMQYLPRLFPAVAGPQDAADLSDEELMSGEGGEWQMASDIDPREAEQMLEALMAGPMGGTMTMQDVEGEG